MGRHSPNNARRQRAPTRRRLVPVVSGVRRPAGDHRFRAACRWSREWEPSAAVWVRLVIPNLAACATCRSPMCAGAPHLRDRAPRERQLSTVAGVPFGKQRSAKSRPNGRDPGQFVPTFPAVVRVRTSTWCEHGQPSPGDRVRRGGTPGFAGSPARLPRRSRGRGRAGNGRRCPT